MLSKEKFKHIFNLYYHPLCRYLLLFTDDYGMIEDVVQSIYIKLWEERENVSDTSIKTYLFIASKNRILNSIRDRQKRNDLLYDYFIRELEKEQAEDIVNMDEFTSLVEESIDHLPPKTKEIFCLRRYNKMSYKDIAHLENISTKTVENHISKALQRISSFLNTHYKKL